MCIPLLRMRAKLLFLRDYPSYTFENKDVFFEGQIMKEYRWYESQRPYLEAALEDMRVILFSDPN